MQPTQNSLPFSLSKSVPSLSKTPLHQEQVNNSNILQKSMQSISHTVLDIKEDVKIVNKTIQTRTPSEICKQFDQIRAAAGYRIQVAHFESFKTIVTEEEKNNPPNDQEQINHLVQAGINRNEASKFICIVNDIKNKIKECDENKHYYNLSKKELEALNFSIIKKFTEAIQSPVYQSLKKIEDPAINFIQSICYSLYANNNQKDKIQKAVDEYMQQIENLALANGIPAEDYGKGKLAALVERFQTARENNESCSLTDIADYIRLMTQFCAYCGHNWDSTLGKIEHLFSNPVYNFYVQQSETTKLGDYNPFAATNPTMPLCQIKVTDLEKEQQEHYIYHVLGGTPTLGNDVHPITYGLLDALQKRNINMLEINLQSPCGEEGKRSKTLVGLNHDAAYSSTITVNTDTVDGPVFHTGAGLLNNQQYEPEAFHKNFQVYILKDLDQYEVDGNGYYFKDADKLERKEVIQSALVVTKDLMIQINPKLDSLSHEEKAQLHQFIFQLIKNMGEIASNAKANDRLIFMEHCKEDVDRGAIKNALTMLCFHLINNKSISHQELLRIIFPLLGRAEIVSNRSILQMRLEPLLNLLQNVTSKELIESLQQHFSEIGCQHLVFDVHHGHKDLDAFSSAYTMLSSGLKIYENMPNVKLPSEIKTLLDEDKPAFVKLKEKIMEELHKPEKDFDIQKVVDDLKTDPAMKPFFEGTAGVTEGYSVEEHSMMVVNTFDRLLPHLEFTEGNKEIITRADMRLFLILHDIGKATAEATTIWGLGRKDKELLYNTIVLEKVLYTLGYDEKKVKIFKALFIYDTLGLLLKNQISVHEAERQIRYMALQAGLKPKIFLNIMEAYFLSDAGSYPVLQKFIFVVNEGKISHSRTNQIKMTALYKAIGHKETTQIVEKNIDKTLKSATQKLDYIEAKFHKDLAKIKQETLEEWLKELLDVPFTEDASIQARTQQFCNDLHQEIELRKSTKLELENQLKNVDPLTFQTLQPFLTWYGSQPLHLRNHLLMSIHQHFRSLKLEETLSQLLNIYLSKTIEKKIDFTSNVAIEAARDIQHKNLCQFLLNLDFANQSIQKEDREQMIKECELLLQINRLLPKDKSNSHIQTTAAVVYEKISRAWLAEGIEDQAFGMLIKAANQIRAEAGHPLYDMPNMTNKLKESKKDSVFIELGSSSTRRRKMRVAEKKIDGHAVYEIEIELPKGIPTQIEQNLTLLKKQTHLAQFSTIEARYLRKDFTNGQYTTQSPVLVGKELKIELKGLGIAYIGTDSKLWNHYNKIRVHIPQEKNGNEIHKIFALLGLPTATLPSREEDVFKENIVRLVHAAYPQAVLKGTPEEVLQLYQSLPEKDKLQLQADLTQMRSKETAPGRVETVLKSRPQQFWDSGGRGFGSFINAGSPQETAKVLMNITKAGCLSTMERFNSGIIGLGCCPIWNMQQGSANQVFTRVLTDKVFENHYNVKNFAIKGHAFLLFHAGAAERLPYSYNKDRAGCRNPNISSTFLYLKNSFLKYFLKVMRKYLKDKTTNNY